MLEDADNINEAIIEIKKHILSFSKFYSKVASTELSQFMYKDSETQIMMLDSIYETNSRLEQLLRAVREYGINAETFRRENQEEGFYGPETEEQQEYKD